MEFTSSCDNFLNDRVSKGVTLKMKKKGQKNPSLRRMSEELKKT